MSTCIDDFKKMGIVPCDILLPNSSVDLSKWAVVACDQFTSEPSYWEEVEDYVGNKPSTFNLIYPECYLNEDNKEQRIAKINKKMNEYVNLNLFDTYSKCFILIKRTCGNSSRLGLMAALDLERYNWDNSAKSLIRATEGTIMSRIPPRKQIRKDAPLEIPHIMVLISDIQKSVIEPLYAKKEQLKKLYDVQLMQNGGQLEAWLVNSQEDISLICDAFKNLYDKLDSDNRMLFAMGDGNHSFATAKSCWEDIKKNLPQEEAENHPARYCLVELENIFDQGLIFEPIHRVLFNVPENVFLEELNKVGSGISFETVACKNCIDKRNKDQTVQGFGYCTSDKHIYVRIDNPKCKISAGTVQLIIDSLIEKGYELDYVHGLDVVDNLGCKEGNIGIILPAIPKETFFEAIIQDGALPRKTFSMGNANEKRYYMESKKINK